MLHAYWLTGAKKIETWYRLTRHFAILDSIEAIRNFDTQHYLQKAQMRFRPRRSKQAGDADDYGETELYNWTDFCGCF